MCNKIGNFPRSNFIAAGQTPAPIRRIVPFPIEVTDAHGGTHAFNVAGEYYPGQIQELIESLQYYDEWLWLFAQKFCESGSSPPFVEEGDWQSFCHWEQPLTFRFVHPNHFEEDLRVGGFSIVEFNRLRNSSGGFYDGRSNTVWIVSSYWGNPQDPLRGTVPVRIGSVAQHEVAHHWDDILELEVDAHGVETGCLTSSQRSAFSQHWQGGLQRIGATIVDVVNYRRNIEQIRRFNARADGSLSPEEMQEKESLGRVTKHFDDALVRSFLDSYGPTGVSLSGPRVDPSGALDEEQIFKELFAEAVTQTADSGQRGIFERANPNLFHGLENLARYRSHGLTISQAKEQLASRLKLPWPEELPLRQDLEVKKKFDLHIVKPGETFSQIIFRYGYRYSDLSEIVAFNPQIKNIDHIRPGDRIKIPLKKKD